MSKTSPFQIDTLLDIKKISPKLKKKLESLNYVRKPSNFDEIIENVHYVELTKEEIRCFEVFHHEVDQKPFDDKEEVSLLSEYKKKVPQYHILIHDKTGIAYLVDTQGFEYPRYVVKIVPI